MRLDRDSWRTLAIMALMLAAFALKGALLSPPHGNASEFNTARSIERLKRIQGDQKAHPVDTAADDDTRNRLIAELNALGIASRIQDAEDCSGFPKSRVVSC